MLNSLSSFISLVSSLFQPRCVACLCRRGEYQYLYILLNLMPLGQNFIIFFKSHLSQCCLTVEFNSHACCVLEETWFCVQLHIELLGLGHELRQNSLCYKWLLLMWQAASVVCRQDCNCNWIVSSGFQTAISVWFNFDRSYSLSVLHVQYVHFYSTCIFNNTPLLVLNSECLLRPPVSHSIK